MRQQTSMIPLCQENRSSIPDRSSIRDSKERKCRPVIPRLETHERVTSSWPHQRPGYAGAQETGEAMPFGARFFESTPTTTTGPTQPQDTRREKNCRWTREETPGPDGPLGSQLEMRSLLPEGHRYARGPVQVGELLKSFLDPRTAGGDENNCRFLKQGSKFLPQIRIVTTKQGWGYQIIRGTAEISGVKGKG